MSESCADGPRRGLPERLARHPERCTAGSMVKACPILITAKNCVPCLAKIPGNSVCCWRKSWSPRMRLLPLIFNHLHLSPFNQYVAFTTQRFLMFWEKVLSLDAMPC